MEFAEAVKQRRSTRAFSDRRIEPEKIERILECARLAPSWANRQCWSFVIVSEAEPLARLKAASPSNGWLAEAPLIVLACGDPSLSGAHHGIDYWAVDVAIAMEQLVLAATASGLGTCWIGVFDEDEIRQAVGIPPHVRVLAMTPLGYPRRGLRIQERRIKRAIGAGRKPLDEIVHWNHW